MAVPLVMHNAALLLEVVGKHRAVRPAGVEEVRELDVRDKAGDGLAHVVGELEELRSRRARPEPHSAARAAGGVVELGRTDGAHAVAVRLRDLPGLRAGGGPALGAKGSHGARVVARHGLLVVVVEGEREPGVAAWALAVRHHRVVGQVPDVHLAERVERGEAHRARRLEGHAHHRRCLVDDDALDLHAAPVEHGDLARLGAREQAELAALRVAPARDARHGSSGGDLGVEAPVAARAREALDGAVAAAHEHVGAGGAHVASATAADGEGGAIHAAVELEDVDLADAGAQQQRRAARREAAARVVAHHAGGEPEGHLGDLVVHVGNRVGHDEGVDLVPHRAEERVVGPARAGPGLERAPEERLARRAGAHAGHNLPRLHVPDEDGAVGAGAREEHLVGREGQRSDAVADAAQAVDVNLLGQVPDQDVCLGHRGARGALLPGGHEGPGL
mmetsp:Transcript_1219/g.3539  ORF Transcript_1219/g.3539 Transcript_1219/m.3539 type:complete len:448 (+) Transcript_1219:471-1814(+)